MNESTVNESQLRSLIDSIGRHNRDRFVKLCKNNVDYPPKTTEDLKDRLSAMQDLISEIKEDISATQRWKGAYKHQLSFS